VKSKKVTLIQLLQDERNRYIRKERVREGEWVSCDVRNILSQKRRRELFGEEESDSIHALVFGCVTRKRFGYYEVEWRLPDPRLAKKLGVDWLQEHTGKTR
jgi:hypothetical protein